jgi:hypothetical protein
VPTADEFFDWKNTPINTYHRESGLRQTGFTKNRIQVRVFRMNEVLFSRVAIAHSESIIYGTVRS